VLHQAVNSTAWDFFAIIAKLSENWMSELYLQGCQADELTSHHNGVVGLTENHFLFVRPIGRHICVNI